MATIDSRPFHSSTFPTLKGGIYAHPKLVEIKRVPRPTTAKARSDLKIKGKTFSPIPPKQPSSRLPKIINASFNSDKPSILLNLRLKEHLDLRANMQIKKLLTNEAIRNLRERNVKLALKCMQIVFQIGKHIGFISLADEKLLIKIQIEYSQSQSGINDALEESIEKFLSRYSVQTHPEEKPFIIEILQYYIKISYEERKLKNVEYGLCSLGTLLNPVSDPFILKYRGACYLFENSYLGALEYLDKALKLDSKDPFILNHLGLLYLEVDKYQEAMEWFNKTLKVDSQNLIALRSLASAYLKSRDFDQAIKYVRLALRSYSEDKETLKIKEEIIKTFQGVPPEALPTSPS